MQLINAITVFKFELKKKFKNSSRCLDRYLVVHRFIESHKYLELKYYPEKLAVPLKRPKFVKSLKPNEFSLFPARLNSRGRC